MNVHEYRFLLSERAELNRLLRRTRPDEVITRDSFEHRLHDVEAELEAYEGLSPRVVDTRLTFRGAPVAGSRGMSADFSSTALKDFNTSVQSIAASQQRENPLPLTGRIPGGSEYELMITGTTRGSFGFVLEQSSQQMALVGEATPVGAAIEQLKTILESSVGTDEELAKAVENVDQRALKSVEDFLRKLAKKGAVCALEFQGKEFKFQDVAQLHHSADRLSQDNIKEDEVRLEGEFQGFLPKSRRAEIKVQRTDADFLRESIEDIIACPVKPQSNDLPNINNILHQDVRVRAHARRAGTARPRITLIHWQLAE